jgi:hypothetical protein
MPAIILACASNPIVTSDLLLSLVELGQILVDSVKRVLCHRAFVEHGREFVRRGFESPRGGIPCVLETLQGRIVVRQAFENSLVLGIDIMARFDESDGFSWNDERSEGRCMVKLNLTHYEWVYYSMN